MSKLAMKILRKGLTMKKAILKDKANNNNRNRNRDILNNKSNIQIRESMN